MPSKKQRTPQEKKKLSYAKDRRNAYGENDKASRKAIPRRKQLENQKVRRSAKQKLNGSFEMDRIESDLRHDIDRVGGWTKSPDQSLEDHVENRLVSRKERVGRKGRKKWFEK